MKKQIMMLGLGVCSFSSVQAAPKDRPNLLVVMADQFRGDAIGFLGKEAVQTPSLDCFARNAVVLNQAVSGYPVSSPARGMFLSGAYPHENGVLTNCQSHSAHQDVELKKEITCWSDLLKAEGYTTAYIGKWHLDKPYEPFIDCSNNKGNMAWNEWCPPERRHGFDYWVAYGTYDNHLRPLYWNKDAGREEFYYVNQWGPEYEADLAVRYLDSLQQQKEPFAMMISMNPPHTGYDLVPDKYKELYRSLNVDSIAGSLPKLMQSEEKYVNLFKGSLANYYACITGVDEQFGRIVDALKKNGQYDNTIIVFVSDHGDSMGMHNNIGKNIFYEEAMRVPFLVAYGDKLKPRIDNDLLISLEDFYPSILSLMGLKEKIPATVQTRDLSRQIQGGHEEYPASQLYMLNSAVNATGKNLTTGARGIRGMQYTYAIRYKDGVITEEHLYDRNKDPHQLNNIVKELPDTASRMYADLKQKLEEIQDPAVVVMR